MSNSTLDPGDPSSFDYIITHVFSPLRLPDEDDHSIDNDHSLAVAVATVARHYAVDTAQTDAPLWHTISRMLKKLCATVKIQKLDRSEVTSQLAGMNVGDVLAFMIKAQNAAVVFRKERNVTVFESFELSPKAESVMTTQGKLICSYPGPAIEVPNTVFEAEDFLAELVNFLHHMNEDVVQDAVPTTRKAQSTVLETRDTTHPRYITELLTGILRSVGSPAEVVRISKRVGDDVVWNNSKLPWRRSSLWLLIRVVLQTTLDRTSLGRVAYKEFMLFFICHLGKEEICADLSNDLLQVITAKISRRLRKLGRSAPDWLSRIALETCTSLRSILEERWTQVQAAQRLSPPWTPSRLDLSQDIQLTLLESSEYIRNRLANHSSDSPGTGFIPKHRRRGGLNDFLSPDAAFFEEAYCAEPHITLYDVEQAVGREIDRWVVQVTNSDEACVKLEVLANKYSSSALKSYGNNPELLSIMLLTVIELWIALDKIAVREIPMLAEYSPEIPISILESLLVCKAASLDRLCRAHQYLSRRHLQAKSGWSVFSSLITGDTFAVRYYRGSSQLRDIKNRIESMAKQKDREKAAELKEKNARHAELQRQADRTEHSYNTNWRGQYHARHCSKCNILDERRRMQIDIHEWPLPAEQLQAEVVVFELECPISFNMWRSATFHLLVDLCSPSAEPQIPYITLDRYEPLRPYLVQHSRSRITLGSFTKPFAVTHYKGVSIPTTEKLVCLSNGLTLYNFDSCSRVSTPEALGRVNTRTCCTYQLQSGPYSNLQKYVDATTHTSNDVMANQADCHERLSIHEFVAFGHLRSGGSLQWLNILRELRGRSLTFRHPEVHSIIAQAVSQTGPLADSGWVWHQELEQPSFCHAVLEELESLVQDIAANWLEAATMDVVSFLLRRLLASEPDQAVSRRLLELLRTVRSKVFKWVLELSAKLTDMPGDEELRGFLRDCAIICRGTFDVDPAFIPDLLHSARDVDVFIFSAISIHDQTPSKISSLPAYSQLLLDRNRRLSLVLESFISDLIEGDPSDEGISSAVSRVWNDYRPGSKWTALHGPDSRWFSCTTLSTAEQRSQHVHLNLLDGSLLVDGKPLGRLPSTILSHPLYGMLFGEQVLDVIPSDLPGMEYSTRGLVSDHQVYFSLRNGSDLVIRAKWNDDVQIMELIPQEKLKGDLPDVLINGHAHWLNLSTSVIEIRPLESIWEASSKNWVIDCTHRPYRMRKGNEFLLDIRSPSWIMVSGLLKPLDSPSNLVVSVSNCDRPSAPMQLSVTLPRYGLSFYINEDGDLQSRNIRGMVYDENQSIGTFFGLVNRLVLRPKIKDGVDVAEVVPRSILIPEGRVSFRMEGHHVRVEVDTQRPILSERVSYQIYKVDTDLGCLETLSLTNRLYRAYLHALTNGCGTDPLTGRLGTEEALSFLRSASCWSIMKLGPRDAELLSLIASICPSRTWYPIHLTCMQTVEWLDLPANSQHHELYILANGIKEHCERFRSFQEGQSAPLFQLFPSREDHLLERSALRAAHLFPPEFSGLPSGAKCCDVQYAARDTVEQYSGEHRAYRAATTVYCQTVNEAITKDILSMVESWSKTEMVFGDAALSLQYNKSWLTPKLPSVWLKAYNLLRTSDDEKWFQLLFSLPAMAYASPGLADLVPVLVAFGSNERFCSEDPPNYDSYKLSDGYHPSEHTIRSCVSDSAHAFEGSPESYECARYNEDPDDLRQRQIGIYRRRVESDAKTTVNCLLEDWPCETPLRSSLNRNLYDMASFTREVEDYFSSCYHNLKLKEHLACVQKILHAVPVSVTTIFPYSFDPTECVPSSVPWMLTIEQLFLRSEPPLRVHEMTNASPSGLVRLHQLIATAEANAANTFQRRYILALRTSEECLGNEITLSVSRDGQTTLPYPETFAAHYDRNKINYIEGLHRLQQHFGPNTQGECALEQSGQWPRMTPRALLQILASNSPITLTENWKRFLVGFALLALRLQRARRILRLHLDDRHEELRKELENEGCDGWNAETHPDWLLIQLQGNFFIRRVQAEVANEMISPRSGDNTAMQLNMGEGKSSVIVPIVVVDLADGDQLVRVIVPKALTAQMFHLLVDRLGGLTNRRIYFLPFSRSLKVDNKKVEVLRDIMTECMKERGILVVQPEHVLSLKLVSVEKQLPGVKDALLGLPLLELQKWLHSRSRDVLDESDEILHVRYQLVYTIGAQQHMEGFPERWTTTQQILSLVKRHASSIQKLYPHGVEYERIHSGTFPFFRILHSGAGQELVSCIMKDVRADLLPNFNFGQLRLDLQDAIQSFASCENVCLEKVELVKAYFHESPLWSRLLLLRGLLATGILLFAFRERRWRVDYGLAPTRTMLAVPYRAKDVPAQRAEFGHPDVAIILTCLSYYYGGLTDEQLKISFDILLQQDDPSVDYDLWIQECCCVPKDLRTLSGINIRSSEQWRRDVFPLFYQNKATVDFYLSRVVFPKEAKEFPSKLSCSGWDLAEKRERLLTGFSGTNDGCMRMRKLGHGHSIMFFAPLEIDRNIRSLANKGPVDEIDTIDILHWAIRETCDDIQQRAPHWALQGTDHASRYSAWSEYCNDQLTADELSEKWHQPEAKSLEKLYGPRTGLNLLSTLTPNIRKRCDELGILMLRDASMDEEQEREIIHEAERERQVERPPKVSAATHSIHPDIVMFVKTGIVPTSSKAFCPAFKALDATSAATNEADVWSSDLWVTADFQKNGESLSNMDDYLRPVQWIVSGKRAQNKVLVIFSPHEVNLLIEGIRSSKNVHLHLYTPRIIRSMKPCDDLDLYTTPAAPTGWAPPSYLIDQLNVFAGQLYLKDYRTYIRLCRFLCVYARDLDSEEGIEVGHNGFIAPTNRPKHLQNTHSFQHAPIPSLWKLTTIRRKGMSFALTHMGKLLDGRLLSEDDFRDGDDPNDVPNGH